MSSDKMNPNQEDNFDQPSKSSNHFTRKPKSAKGKISIEVDKGWLRLRFTFQGKRQSIAIGLPESRANRRKAEQIAEQIELDIKSGHFDASLARYKPRKQVESEQSNEPTVPSLFRSFMEEKAKEVTPKTMEKYRATLKYLNYLFSNKPVKLLDDRRVEEFVEYQRRQRLSENQIKRRLGELAAAWKWYGEIHNPWKMFTRRVKVPSKQKPRPFSKKEMEAIIQGFQHSKRYAWYADFVKFLFRTGCRTGEVIGLRWKHLSEDCSSVWIGEIWSRGKQCPPKMNKDRCFALNSTVQKLLLSRKTAKSRLDDLVFPSPRGLGIDDHNFSQRGWRKVLKEAGVPYRKLYNTRYTFISLALAEGAVPIMLSNITGHDLETMLKHYAGISLSSPELPEI